MIYLQMKSFPLCNSIDTIEVAVTLVRKKTHDRLYGNGHKAGFYRFVPGYGLYILNNIYPTVPDSREARRTGDITKI